MDAGQREAAAEYVRRAMMEQRLSLADVIRKGPVDNKTLQGLLSGQRWPQVKTRVRVEEALGMAPGAIERAARGLPDAQGPQRASAADQLSDTELIAVLAYRLGRAALVLPEQVEAQEWGDRLGSAPGGEDVQGLAGEVGGLGAGDGEVDQ